ncbi:MAG: transglutaminase domain-containing protein [Chloroflexia bacterium]|nr:transglutaminase domain-containing protein [Chloroflexia bacterium]
MSYNIRRDKLAGALLFLLATLIISCNKKDELHFITDADYRKTVENDFLKVQEIASHRAEALFSVFKKDISNEKAEALKFLFAYMPLNDLADYDGEFFLRNVELAFAARDSFSWGKTIPEDVFRHFVLPHRVNNENLDSSRSVFFKELFPRIKNLSLEEAALEVNHWCHEKVNYQPTDSRTVCPLGAIKAAYGRCGEESTFTVTALRSVGIPARQVYTPRWAHSDDNHAWVEVFVNGEWKYLGACEPEPALDMGWFSAPVKRAMMVHTKAFGKYKGNEDIIDEHEKYATLNVLKNYSPVRDIWVKVVDETGMPVEKALVEFGLYNYAEYYPLKSQTTEKDGLAHIKTGLGDLRIFASNKNTLFALKKINVAETDTLILRLDKSVGDGFIHDYENIPPVEKALEATNEAGAEKNKTRLAFEDSIRNQYIKTFYTREKSDLLAEELGLDKDRIWPFFEKSRGNYKELESYLRAAADKSKDVCLDLLDGIVIKDFYDGNSQVWLDHFNHYTVFEGTNYPSEIAKEYILSPRIYLEGLKAYREYFQHEFSSIKKETPRETIVALIDWTKQNIKIDEESNYYNIESTPVGTHQLRVCSDFSRKTFFIAVARSLGIPARLEPATHAIQYYDKDWVNVVFEENTSFDQPDMATIKLKYNHEIALDPQYRIHFGIAKFKDGHFETLHYDWEKPLSSFPEKLELEAGYYQILTGNRLKDGMVLTKCHFMNIEKDSEQAITLTFNLDQSTPKIIATWKTDMIDNELDVIGWLDPKSEPGNHFLNDFQALKKTFADKNINMEIYCSEAELKDLILQKLPNQYFKGVDKDLAKLNEMYLQTKLNNTVKLPVFIVINKKGEIFYHSAGYNIGTSEQILKIYNRLVKK